ncbi:hypothetical protein P7K49_000075 [Saguinus oedipus]|uniref:Uncharacterized protein n=1 Tax=Saguinus oedipus TaxID=9490 RepID=A0ABQ9WCA5_SAGOE|nr:hypothetical protein P7K49_000075 [Saguinus oedipus]
MCVHMPLRKGHIRCPRAAGCADSPPHGCAPAQWRRAWLLSPHAPLLAVACSHHWPDLQDAELHTERAESRSKAVRVGNAKAAKEAQRSRHRAQCSRHAPQQKREHREGVTDPVGEGKGAERGKCVNGKLNAMKTAPRWVCLTADGSDRVKLASWTSLRQTGVTV